MTLPDFLVEWSDGAIVIKGHRIGLYDVVVYHNDGLSVEQLHEQFPDLSREGIEKALQFYRENQAEVDAFIAKEQEEMDRTYAELGPRFSREELLRWAEEKQRAGR